MSEYDANVDAGIENYLEQQGNAESQPNIDQGEVLDGFSSIEEQNELAKRFGWREDGSKSSADWMRNPVLIAKQATRQQDELLNKFKTTEATVNDLARKTSEIDVARHEQIILAHLSDLGGQYQAAIDAGDTAKAIQIGITHEKWRGDLERLRTPNNSAQVQQPAQVQHQSEVLGMLEQNLDLKAAAAMYPQVASALQDALAKQLPAAQIREVLMKARDGVTSAHTNKPPRTIGGSSNVPINRPSGGLDMGLLTKLIGQQKNSVGLMEAAKKQYGLKG